ncbi:hypothetical protein ASG42_22675 [Rhizobium sp. Leaf391]|nr:hypothetical protein ASG50_10985 [Rhizobium sp. Leaf386]KQT04977.1 hypothetical protein ASG42_22675 [Rhizobium sp. Leaf391]
MPTRCLFAFFANASKLVTLMVRSPRTTSSETNDFDTDGQTIPSGVLATALPAKAPTLPCIGAPQFPACIRRLEVAIFSVGEFWPV